MKYAAKASAVIVTEIINWNNISAPYNPTPYNIGGMKNTQRGNYKHDCFKRVIEPVLRLAHQVPHLRKRFVYAAKLFGDFIHMFKDKRRERRCQAQNPP